MKYVRLCSSALTDVGAGNRVAPTLVRALRRPYAGLLQGDSRPVETRCPQEDLISADAVAGPADREVLVGELLGGQRRDRLRDGVTDRATVAERAVEADRERARRIIVDGAVHADDAVDRIAERLSPQTSPRKPATSVAKRSGWSMWTQWPDGSMPTQRTPC